jgi:hypothetical protein
VRAAVEHGGQNRGTRAPAKVQGVGPLAPAEVSYVSSGVHGSRPKLKPCTHT